MQGAARALDAFGALPQAANEASARAKDSVYAPAAQAFMQRLDHYAESSREGAAAAEWFTLYDDYRKLPTAQAQAQPDPRTGLPLSMLSLIAVLPAPQQWGTMREQARARAASTFQDADERVTADALVLLFDALFNDPDAQAATLQELRRATQSASKQRREQALPLLDEWEAYLAYDKATATAATAIPTPAAAPASAEPATLAAAPASPDGTLSVAATVERLRLALSTPDGPDAASSFGHAQLALKLAAVGVLEKNDAWLQQGIEAAKKALVATRSTEYAAQKSSDASDDRARLLSGTVRMLRDAGRVGEAEQLLIDELAAIGATCRGMPARACHERFAEVRFDVAPRLLLALYAGLQRDADARLLADRYALWSSDDAALLSVDLGFPETVQPALAIVRALVAAGEKDKAIVLLKAMAAQPHVATPEVARTFGQIAGDEAVGEVLLQRQHLPGPRNAIAALAAAGAGLWPRAQELALAARREQLYAPWRAAMDEVLAGAADAAHDAAGGERWRAAAAALALDARALRYAQAGALGKAAEIQAQAMTRAQPGDCIEDDALALDRERHDAAAVALRLQQLAHNAQHDESGGALGCLKQYLELQPAEYQTLRAALSAGAADAVPGFGLELPYLQFTLDDDCNLRTAAAGAGVCVDPQQYRSDARAAYDGIKRQLHPWDIDPFATLDAMVRHSAFPSLYAGHLDHVPAAPTVVVNAFERDDWPLRLVRLDPSQLPAAVERKHDAHASYWSPVVHLADYWLFAHGTAAKQEAPASAAAYPLPAATQLRASSGVAIAHMPPKDPSLRANLAVASTEIVQTAVRLIEPGRHDPCTTCP